jgi:DNA-binding beta-propeller fold protein YncE
MIRTKLSDTVRGASRAAPAMQSTPAAPQQPGCWRIRVIALCVLGLACSGCLDPGTPGGDLELVWGTLGQSDGRMKKPRAMTIDDKDQLYIVDLTARIQVFTPDGEFLRSWQTPVHVNGRPTGLGIDRDGNILVADTHYFRVLIYTPQGELIRTIGGRSGIGPGEFGFVTDVVQDSQGYYYVSEYGEYDRVQKFTREGKFVLEWGGHGTEPGQFMRPQGMIIDANDQIWVCDACNHRIQVFDTSGKLIKLWGQQGHAPGELNYPYGLTFGKDDELYIIEYGNHRVQKFTLDGASLGCWGTHGRGPGQTHNPWALAYDSQGRLHVLDSNNHRVQRIRF